MDLQESFVQSGSVPIAIPRGVSGWAHPYNVGGFNPTVLQVNRVCKNCKGYATSETTSEKR